MKPNPAIAPPDTYIGMAGVSEVRWLAEHSCQPMRATNDVVLGLCMAESLQHTLCCLCSLCCGSASRGPGNTSAKARSEHLAPPVPVMSLGHYLQVGGGHFFAEEAGEVEGDMPGHDDAGKAPQGSQDAAVSVAVTYTISADGSIDMAWTIDASQALPAPLPAGLFKCALAPGCPSRLSCPQV